MGVFPDFTKARVFVAVAEVTLPFYWKHNQLIDFLHKNKCIIVEVGVANTQVKFYMVTWLECGYINIFAISIHGGQFIFVDYWRHGNSIV